MDLRNADGSFAEMSGNGVRCLVQAAVAAGMVRAGTVNVDTAGGRRAVDYTDMGGGAGFAEVEMGPVSIGPDLALDEPPVSLARPGIVVRACKVNVGNPHIVLLAGEDGEVDVDIDLPTVGPLIEKFVDGGANVEVLRLDPDRDRGRDRGEGPGITDPAGVSSLDIDVWERGVGMTEACGTGACAAAAAAANWGLASATVEVASGGGILVVRLGQGKATLAGPARMVGEVIVELAVLAELVADRDTARAGDETTATVATAAAPAYATAKTATEATRLHVKDVKDVKDAKDVIAAP
jgi:diaminopimelate epimerase